MRNALITANVFQNVFKDVPAKQVPRQEYYIDLLRRLASKPVTWYMTAYDYTLAWVFWDIFRLRTNETYQEAYLELLLLVRVIQINDWILDETGYYHQLNFCEALRLACAVDRNLDAIVSWEPHLFARTVAEHREYDSNWYFFVNVPVKNLEAEAPSEFRIGVFSVGAFWLHLDGMEGEQSPRLQRLQRFRLERFCIKCEDENEASIILCDLTGEQIKTMARGTSPFDAIQKAIDQAVDQCLPVIPPRYLSRFFVPQATLFGADAPVEVVIRVECGGQSFQESASHSSVLRAAADAYVEVINRICRHPNLPIVA